MFDLVKAACGRARAFVSQRLRGARVVLPMLAVVGATVLGAGAAHADQPLSAGCTYINAGNLDHTVRYVGGGVSGPGTTARFSASASSYHNFATVAGATDPFGGPTLAPGVYPMTAGETITIHSVTTNYANGGALSASIYGGTGGIGIGADGSGSASYTVTGSESALGISSARIDAGPSADIAFTASCTAAPSYDLSIDDVSLNEGDAGTTNFTFTVSLSQPAGAGGVTFDIATADGTATAGSDYVARSLTSQTIPAGSSTYSFTVSVNGDTTPEPSETFFVNVTNVTGATVVDGQGRGTIINDDITSVTSVTPNSGSTAGGTAVTIGGTNLTGATAVTIGGNAATNVVVAGDGLSLTANTPSGSAGAATVAVTTPGGTGQLAGGYTYIVLSPPTATTQPSSQTVGAGASVTFTAAAVGSPTPTVQWQRSTDGGQNFSDVAGATSASYSFTAAAGDNGYRYRAVFMNSQGTATTSAATLTVIRPPVVQAYFTPTYIERGNTSTLWMRVDNPNSSVTLSGINVSLANLPNGMTVEAVLEDCNGAYVSAPGQIGVQGLTLFPTQVCFLRLTVRATVGGNLTFTTGTPTATGPISLTGVASSGSIFVNTPPAATLTGFSPDAGPSAGGQTVTATGSGFVAGQTSVWIGGITVPANQVTVLSSTSLTFVTPARQSATVNAYVEVSGEQASLGNAYTYMDAPIVQGSVSPGAIAPGGVARVTTQIRNPNGRTFFDLAAALNLPAGVTVAASPNVSASCSGAVSAAPGAGTVTLSGGQRPAGTCSIAFDVTATTVGSYSIPTGSVTAAEYGIPTSGAASTLTVAVPPPTTSSASPDVGPTAGGQSVTVTGTNFVVGDTSVTIDGTVIPTGAVTVSGETSLTFITPAHSAGNVQVTVSTSNGTSGPVAGGYTYVSAPIIGSLSPAAISTEGGATVTVTGSNFVTGLTSVTVDGAQVLPVDVMSSTTLSFTAPAHAMGVVNVVVTTPGGSATGANLTYVGAPTANAQSVNVTYQTATAITLSGSDSNTPARALTYAVLTAPTHGTLSGTVPNLTYTPAAGYSGPDSFSFTVNNGVSTSAPATVSLTVQPPAPTVSAISPTAGPAAGGTSVTVTGSAFMAGSTSVTIDGTVIPVGSVTVNSATSLTFVTPSHADGNVAVTVTTPSGTSNAAPGGFTYLGVPTVSGMTPDQDGLSGGRSVTVSGTGFAVGETSVTLGGTTVPPSSVTVNSPTSLTFTAPAHAMGQVNVSVTTPSGTGSMTNAFVYVAPPTAQFSWTPSTITPGGTSVFTIVVTNPNPTARLDLIRVRANPFGAGFGFVSLGSVGCTESGGFDPQAFTTTLRPLAPGATCTVTGNFSQANAGSYVTTGSQLTADGTQAGPLALSGVLPTSNTLTVASAPAVTSLSPTSGPAAGGTLVTLTGTDFSNASAVSFGGAPATSFTVVSPTTITATSPNGSGVINVTVTTPNGTSATSAANAFTYVQAPTVTSVSPTAGPTAGGTSVTITGTNLTNTLEVTFGGTAAQSFSVDSATQITAVSPNGAGTVDIRVTTVGGTSATSASDQFTYVAAPVVSSISPTSGPSAGGAVVTITGSNLLGATGVTFGAAPANSFAVIDANTIQATAPSGAGVVDVRVTTAGGTSATSVADQFTYVQAPTVTSASPNAGPTAGGTSVTITGTNLLNATAVIFGAAPAQSFVVNSATQITAVSPAGTGRVNVRVTTAGGTSTASTSDEYLYIPPPSAPTITSPGNGQAVANPTPPITGGSDLGSTVSVYIDGAFSGTAPMGFGPWIYIPPTPLSQGSHTVYAIATGVGGASQPSATVTFIVDSIAPATPVIVTPTEGQVTGGSVTYAGTAEANATVLISIDSGFEMPQAANAAGAWSLSQSDLASGPHTITVRARDLAGNTSQVATRNFVVDATPPPAPVVTYPTQNAVVTDANASVTGTAEAGATVSIILDGANVGTAVATGGTWSFPLTGLSQGPHMLSTFATDPQGNQGQNSSPIQFSVSLLNLDETPLPGATVGTAYSQTITATGGQGPLTFTVIAATPPPGVTLASNGALTGTPTQSGTYSFNVQVTDGQNSDFATYMIVVDAPPPPTADPETVVVPAPQAGQPSSIDLSGSVGSARSIEIVTPPSVGSVQVNGLSVTYTPQPGYFGDVTFTYRAIGIPNGNDQPPVSQPATVTITYAAPTLTMTPATGALPGAQVAQAYSQAFTAEGGTATYTYAVTSGALPAGLTLSTGGVLSGTPTAGGTFNFTVTATDSSTGSGPFSVSNPYSVVVAASAITLTPATLPNGSRGTAYSQTLSATGGVAPYTYGVSSGSLPTGLTLSTAGVLSGTPTATGSFTFTVQATDSATGTGPYSGVQSYTVAINALTLTVTPTTLPSATAGVPVSQQFSTTGGQGTYSYAVTAGALPTGVTLSTTGLLSGAPATGGTYAFTVTASDTFGNTGSVALSWVVTARPDPSLDPDVRGISSAQAQATRRFGETQIDNFTRRLEQLHRPGAGNAMNLSLNGGAFSPLDENQLIRPELGRVMGEGLIEMRDALGRSDAEVAAANRLAAQDQSRAGSGPTGLEREPGRIRVWAGGMISLGERDATTQTADLDIRTSGVSVGADTSLSDTLDVGAGIGFGQERTDVGDNGSRMEADSWVGVGYASWRPSEDWFLDAIAGYGQLSFDTTRRTPVDQSMVFGQRGGSIAFGSLSAGVDRTEGAVRWSAYGRTEVLNADLDAYTETGSPIWALSYEARDVQSLQGVAGFRYERDVRSSATTTWTPGVRFELSHEFGDEGGQTLRYADLLSGPVYAIGEEGWDRTQTSVGISLQMHDANGWTVNGEADTRFGGEEVMTTIRLVAGRRF